MSFPISRHHPRHDSPDSILGDDNPRSPAPATPAEVSEQPKKKLNHRSAKTPLMKNDMGAKLAVIKEIESFWGPNFIKRFIPQCHRPLVKRPPGTTRNIPRFHEEDPKRWKPSVLKAIRMICEKTDDAQLVKKLMGKVIMYRNKNTGNKKPEVVTTDFDVIEDVITEGWTVEKSFEIRYKHLMANHEKIKREGLGEIKVQYYDDSEEEDREYSQMQIDVEDYGEEVEEVKPKSKSSHPRSQPTAVHPRTTQPQMQALGQRPLPEFKIRGPAAQALAQPHPSAVQNAPSDSSSEEPLINISARKHHLKPIPAASPPRSISRGRRRTGHWATGALSSSVSVKQEWESEEKYTPSDLNFGMGSSSYNVPPAVINQELDADDLELLEAEMQVAEANARQARLRLELLRRRRGGA